MNYILTAALMVFAATQSWAATLISTDFNSATVATYTDGQVINSGGATTDDISVFSNNALNFVSVAGGADRSLTITDNNASAATSGINAGFSAISTGASGENLMTSSFDFTRLGGGGTAIFHYSTGGNTPSGANTAIQFQVNANSGVLGLFNGTSFQSGLFTLTTGTEYTFEINGDFSSTTQDSWSLNIYTGGLGGTVVYDSTSDFASGINTRAADIAVSNFAISTGATPANNNASPYGELDNLSIVSVPEPSTYVLLAAGFLALYFLRSRKHA
ncbi:MAG: PEP-CTERM sorting domain-containing protein [Verrucomicrobiota bacterium]